MCPVFLFMIYFIIGIGLVVLDQLTKYLIKTNLDIGQCIQIIGEFFQITHVKNPGAAFSILSGQRVFLVLLPIIGIIAAIIVLSRRKGAHFTLYLSWALIISGGIGNLIDRVLYGEVTDMISFSIFPPVFNVADIGVTCGCALLVVYTLLSEKLNKK